MCTGYRISYTTVYSYSIAYTDKVHRHKLQHNLQCRLECSALETTNDNAPQYKAYNNIIGDVTNLAFTT